MYKIEIMKPEEGSDIPALVELFAGDFGRTDIEEDGDRTLIVFTTPTRAVSINVVQILMAEDVSFRVYADK